MWTGVKREERRRTAGVGRGRGREGRGEGRADAAVRVGIRRPAARVRTCKRINFSRAFMLAD